MRLFLLLAVLRPYRFLTARMVNRIHGNRYRVAVGEVATPSGNRSIRFLLIKAANQEPVGTRSMAIGTSMTGRAVENVMMRMVAKSTMTAIQLARVAGTRS